MELKACPFCGGEVTISGMKCSRDRHRRVYCTAEENEYNYFHIRCRTCYLGFAGFDDDASAAWNKRFVCPDMHGNKVYAGDEVKTADCSGKVDRLGGIHIESEDGHLHHVWPSEIELIQPDGKDD